jgi:hypothetical protein
VTTNRVLLPHPREPRLLLLQAHGEWRLPEWDDPTAPGFEMTDHLNRAVAERFGMETTVLRCVLDSVDPASQRTLRVYELDNHTPPHDLVASSTWVGRSELDMRRVAEPEMRELLGAWFGREAGELPARGPAWTRRGWYIEALAWAIARLREVGVTGVGTPEQLRASERSFLMRLVSAQGAFHFKAVPPVFAHEPAVVRLLAEHHPDNLPQIVALDAERGWFLQREVADAALPLDEVREEEEWYRAVRRLAEIQLDTVHRVRELRAAGCPHRGLDVLARRIPRLCADAGAMLLGHPAGLNRREITQVAGLTPTLLALCEELASYDLPEALEHGDLRADNVLSTISGPLYLDWSESSISHPFFSPARLMIEAARLVPAASGETRRQLRDSYLMPWQAVAPHDQLVRAFQVARVLAPVHVAATLHAELLPTAGHRRELAPAVPTCMRGVLQLLLEESSADG